MSEDPKLFDAGDYNLFRHCHNDPINHTDPMGLEPPPTYSNRQTSLTIAERISLWQKSMESSIGGERAANTIQIGRQIVAGERFLRQYYKQYQQKLNAGIAKVFGPMAALVPYQTASNAPNVVLNMNAKQIYDLGQKLSAAAPKTGVQGEASGYNTMPNEIRGRGFVDAEGPRGTVFIASDYRGDKNRVYTHELGNNLSTRLTRDPNAFGSIRFPDHDTGQNLEHAVFDSGR